MAEDISPGERAPLDLRSRRRLATASEISEAALHLFETNGVDQTTVVDIALAAGVSPRTFFRYFDTKEQAALVDLGYMQDIKDWSTDGANPIDDYVGSLLTVVRQALQRLDQSDQRRHLLRMARLIRTEPAIKAASLRSDAEHTAILETALRARAGHVIADLDLRVLSRVIGSLIYAATEAWEEGLAAGEVVDLVSVFDKSVVAVKGALGDGDLAVDAES